MRDRVTDWLRANRQDFVWSSVIWLFMGTPACIDLYLAYSTETPAASSYTPAIRRETDHWPTDIFGEGESE